MYQLKLQANLLVAILLVCFCLPIHAVAADYTYKGVRFQYEVSDGKAVVIAFDREATNVVIPAAIEVGESSLSVSEVGTFSNGTTYNTTELVLEEGIQVVASSAFAEFRQLRKVTLPSTIRRVGANAFRNNPGLKFSLPKGLNEKHLKAGIEVEIEVEQEKPKQGREAKSEEPKYNLDELIAQIRNVDGPDLPKPVKPTPPAKPITPKTEPTTPKPNSPQVPSPRDDTFASDVDRNIPSTGRSRENTYVIIIANEHYQEAPDVKYAISDGRSFRKYCEMTLGIPTNNINMFEDATMGQMARAIHWMEGVQQFDTHAQFIFYYSGHGMPDEHNQAAYIIPADGYPADLGRTAVSMKEIYDRLGAVKAERVVVLLDACFSGMRRGESDAILPARGVAIKPRDEALSGNVMVFTAASENETAMAYDKQQHGLFTYYLLKALKETRGDLSCGELFDSVSRNVKRVSHTTNHKMQTPTQGAAPAIQSEWRQLRF